MKRLAFILGVAALTAALTVPAFARGRGWGMGGGYCRQNDETFRGSAYRNKWQGDSLEQEFYEETAMLRDDIRTKKAELETLLNDPNPDRDRLRTLQKETNDLQAKMDERRLDFRIEHGKALSEDRYGNGYGRRYGRHMRDYESGFTYGYRGKPGYGMGWN